MAAGSGDARRTRAEARADLIRRLFAVAISVGFAATLARMTWVQNGALPGPAELNQTLILGTALLAAVLGWESHLLAMAEKPLFGFSRFLVNLVLVFIYMFLLMASAHPECMLWTLAVVFVLYVVWDVLTMREQIASYDPALEGAPAPSPRRLECLCRRLCRQRAGLARTCDHAGLGRLFRPAGRGRGRTRLRAHPHDMRVRTHWPRGLLDGRDLPDRAPARWTVHAPADPLCPDRADRGRSVFPVPVRRVAVPPVIPPR